MSLAPTMTLACTVVHAPGSVPESLWNLLRLAAAGAHAHELRILLEGATAPCGAQIDDALHSWVRSIRTAGFPGTTDSDVAVDRSWVAVLDHRPLEDHAADSASIHQGMVVVLHAQFRPTRRAAHASPPLRLCISNGPDSGRMVSIPRGVHMLGRGTQHRGTADIRINDPRLEPCHASIKVSADQVMLARPGTVPQLLRTDVPVSVGGSRVELVQDVQPAAPPGIWPLPPVHVCQEAPSARQRTMLLMSLAPLIVGIVLVLVTGMWIFLLFSAASALIAVVTLLVAHRHRRRFRRAVRAGSSEWGRQRRDLLAPPGAAIRALRARSHPRNSLTCAEDGGVVVTVGEARIDAELQGPGDADALVDLPELSVSTATALTLRRSECTALLGPSREQLSVLRWILAQLTHHFGTAPQVVLATGPDEIDGAQSADLLCVAELRDYTHVSVVPRNSLHTTLTRRQLRPAAESAPVLISPTQLDPVHTRAALDAGWHVISPALPTRAHEPTSRPSEQQAPAPTTADGWQVDLESGQIHRIEAGAARRVATGLVPDGLSRRTLHDHLRLGLPRIAGAAAETEVPTQCTAALPEPLMAGSAHLRLETLLGRGAAGEELLDLVEDGPHILLAGTTGAGKSELLKSMLLGWASRYDPSELNFLLFDFKGGSSFQHLARLEHTLSLVTDLTQEQADRALEGVRSELARRERMFLESGATDYADFRRFRPDRPLARILVVFDEFRIFTQELPAAMDELLRLATLGRSLGLHLILTTQRPQGVVTADIRANIGTIICLRLRSDDEARELVGTTEPAHIPRRLPGRGVIQRPGESPVPFHAVQLRERSAKLTARPERAPRPAGAGWRETTRQLVEALDAHIRRRQVRRPHTPLLPPLPELLRAPLPAQEILFGLLDDPAQQTQRLLHLDLNAGEGTALLGEAGSGGTACVESLVRQLLARPEPVHIYLLDGDHSLQGFRSHSRVGSWVTTDHPQEAGHLVSELHRLVVGRRVDPSRERFPLVLVLTGHSRWHQSSQTAGGGDLEYDLGALISEGIGYGLSVVIAGGRELALGRLGSRLPRRIYLPYGVSEDVRHLWPKLRVTDRLSGRGVLITADVPAPGLTLQLVTGTLEQPPASSATEVIPPVSRSLLRVHPLPESVDLPALEPDSGALVLGLSQFTHLHARLEDHSWQVGLLLGTSRSGKTNALHVVAAQRRCLTLAELSPSGDQDDVDAEAADLLLVDDADQCTPEQHRNIEAWLESGGRVLATAQPSMNVFRQLPWGYRARTGSANFVLSPLSRSQGDAFGISIPILTRLTPGRAVWIGSEKPRIIQWWRHRGMP
ncbi:FtsK/SpoIIIE domain-containing protein [Nesterenkonia aurantiaca]|uniref:FtsK/SpoIIIE domain-containing protein n=1 Tax=Nesterenkonia aurantiaca TaxID=1436010 RepID=UPI003EE7ED6F